MGFGNCISPPCPSPGTPMHIHLGQARDAPGAVSPTVGPAALPANPGTKRMAREGPCGAMFAKHLCLSSSGSKEPGCAGFSMQDHGREALLLRLGKPYSGFGLSDKQT